jgi:hypothetical protein
MQVPQPGYPPREFLNLEFLARIGNGPFLSRVPTGIDSCVPVPSQLLGVLFTPGPGIMPVDSEPGDSEQRPNITARAEATALELDGARRSCAGACLRLPDSELDHGQLLVMMVTATRTLSVTVKFSSPPEFNTKFFLDGTPSRVCRHATCTLASHEACGRCSRRPSVTRSSIRGSANLSPLLIPVLNPLPVTCSGAHEALAPPSC